MKDSAEKEFMDLNSVYTINIPINNSLLENSVYFMHNL